jgi:hypothetical protein
MGVLSECHGQAMNITPPFPNAPNYAITSVTSSWVYLPLTLSLVGYLLLAREHTSQKVRSFTTVLLLVTALILPSLA